LALLSIQGIAYSTKNSLVSYSLSQLPTGQQNITVNSSQSITSQGQYQEVDKYLSTKLSGIVTGPITREIIYSQLSDTHGVHFYFGASNKLKNSIQLTGGRFPTNCSASLCEVLQIGGAQSAVPRPLSFGLKIVGKGKLLDRNLFAGTIGAPSGTPLLIASGIAGATSLPRFANYHGTDGWVGSIDVQRIFETSANTFASRVVAFEDQLSIDFPNLILTWPQDALSAASDSGVSFGEKVTLLNFVIVALLLAFIALFFTRQRNEHFQFRAALSRIGTPKRTLAGELFLESAIPVIVGVFIAGILSPLVPIVLRKFNFDLHLASIYVGWPKYLLIVGSAIALATGVSVIFDFAWRRIQWFALGISLLFFAYYLQQNPVSDSRSLSIPFFFIVGPLLLSYLLLHLVSLWWRNRIQRTFFIYKEYHLIWQGISSVIALTTLLAALSLSFSSGISQQVAHDSRNQVPLDISIRTGPSLLRPLDVGGVQDYESLQPGVQAFPILRTGTSIRGDNSVSDSLSLIGAPVGAISLAEPALSGNLLRGMAIKENAQPGLAIGSTKEIEVTLSGVPPEIDLIGWFRTPRATHLSEPFTGSGSRRLLTLAGQVPQGSSLIAFELRESSNYLSRRLHAIGEGDVSVPLLKGIGSVSKILFDNKPRTLPQLWGLKNFPYSFDGQSLYLQPKLSSALPKVIVDPVTAALATHGVLEITGASNNYFQVKIEAIVKYFPSAGDRFVIMELSQMQGVIAQTDLGATDPIELWIKTPNPIGYVKLLNVSSMKNLSVESRFVLERELNSDPNNVGLLSAYRVALGLATLIALLIAMTSLRLVYREGREVLFALETFGATPSSLRQALRTLMRVSSGVGLLVGTLIGALIGRLFISPSIPYLLLTLVLLISSAIIEIIMRLLSHGFFAEEVVVGSSS
jgi:hypothetical protein